MTMVEGTSIDLGDPSSQDVEQIEIETPEERLLTCKFLLRHSVNGFAFFYCAQTQVIYNYRNSISNHQIHSRLKILNSLLEFFVYRNI